MTASANTLTRQALSRKRLVLLALGMICLLFIGLIYGYSMFVLPMKEDFGLDDIGPVFYIMMVAFCIGTLSCSFLLKRFAPRTMMIAAAILFAIAFCSTGMLGKSVGVPVLYVSYAIIGGLASGVGYTGIVGTVVPWFPDRTGLASGLLLLGFGISSLLLGNIVLAMRAVTGSIGTVFVGVGIAGAVLSLLLAALLTRPPVNIAQIMATGSGSDAETPSEAERYDPSIHFENDSVLKTPIFIVYFVAFTLVSVMGLGVIGSIASDGMMLGLSELFSSTLVGLVALSNGLIRIVLGALIDRKGTPFTYIFEAVVTLLGMLCILAAFIFELPTLYVIGALSSVVAYNPVLSSAFVRLRFGPKRYPINLAIINLCVLPAALINIVLSNILGPDARFEFFIIATINLVLTLIASLIFRKLWRKDFTGIDSVKK
ncbi:MAG: MFS transporter [Eggerthellaceae bacterium]|nr:MFS transporter [Eggerthellaceae bacterium]